MQAEFDILKSDFGKKINSSKVKYGKVALIGIPILAIILTDVYFSNFNLIFIAVIYFGISFLLSKFLQKSNNQIIEEILEQKIGQLELNDGTIKLSINDKNNQSHKIGFSSINEMDIKTYFGEVTGYGRYQELHYGTDTTININRDSITEKFYVFIRNKEEREIISLISNLCILKNLEYKEYTNGERTYNGKKLNYQEIQNLKKTIINNVHGDHIG